MAGIKITAPFLFSAPQPLLLNAAPTTVAARLAPGQLRHTSWRYSQDSPEAHYRIKPLAICFLADGVTPATQAGTWGTLEAHWRLVPVTSDDLPEGINSLYYTAIRAALKADKASLATVATSGSYADLLNKPAAPANTAVQASTVERTTAFALALTDAGAVVPVNSATPVTLTISLNSAVPFPIGTYLYVSQVGAGQVLITATAGVTLHQSDGQYKTAKQWAEIKLRKRGLDEWVLTGSTAL